MSVPDGKIVIDATVVNPSMSCPDMFSWKLFVDVVPQEWWANWATDEETWPGKPYKLCADGKPGPDCCLPGASNNPGYDDPDNRALHCPYFPGDQKEIAELRLQPRKLGKPIGAHAVFLGRGGLATGFTTMLAKPGEPEPGRVIRQEVGEITVRNKAMFDYIFTNDLYNGNGVAAVFDRNRDDLANHAPYHATNPAGALTKVDLPIPAIMIKSNWLYKGFAKQLNVQDVPPHIKNNMTTRLPDPGFPRDRSKDTIYEGEHWLMSFHISTKDTPQWVWTTFEHVTNPGRCDFTGCNDSYGYGSPDSKLPSDAADNFTNVHVKNDGLRVDSMIFELGEQYPGGKISAGLAAVFKAKGFGSTDQGNRKYPLATDKGWLSYRLKGSQVNFTNAMGRATRLGNSITEGGFMTTSSCIACHARASVKASGDPKSPLVPPLGVFLYDVLSEVGYRQSAMGIPDKDWYHGSGFTPSLQALQTDFIWGMPFFAQPLVTAE